MPGNITINERLEDSAPAFEMLGIGISVAGLDRHAVTATNANAISNLHRDVVCSCMKNFIPVSLLMSRV
jgi:hypothetical protein